MSCPPFSFSTPRAILVPRLQTHRPLREDRADDNRGVAARDVCDAGMKAIATFGAGGQVGYALCGAQWPSGVYHVPLEHHLCDIADHDKVLSLLERSSISLVINAAAYTAVDLAESHAEECWDTNAQGPANLARSCAALGIPVIQISTDYVFDGNKGAPYLEIDSIAPINSYGRAKAAGEQAVRE